MSQDATYPRDEPEPSPDLRALDRLVGTWDVSGGANGMVTYEWLEGGFFLLQHVDFDHDGRRIRGLEVIGHERPFGAAEPGPDLKSRFYDSLGNTLDYVYELEGTPSRSGAGRRARPPTTGGPSARTARPAPAPGCTRRAAATSRR
jgi:hypothetical protein